MELLTPEIGTIFWTAVVFLVMLIVLSKVAWKPIITSLSEREKSIKESLKKVNEINKQYETIAIERENEIKKARDEAQELIIAARKSAEQVRESIHSQAQKEAEKMLERAKSEIESSRENVLKEMRQMAIELSMAATTKLIKKNIDEREHKTLIQEFLTNLEKLN